MENIDYHNSDADTSEDDVNDYEDDDYYYYHN